MLELSGTASFVEKFLYFKKPGRGLEWVYEMETLLQKVLPNEGLSFLSLECGLLG
jgi:hypothetical protein